MNSATLTMITTPIQSMSFRKFKRGDRLYKPMYDLLIPLCAIAYATSAVRDDGMHLKPDQSMRISTRQFSFDYIFPMTGPIEQVVQNTVPDFIEIGEDTRG